MQKVLRALEVEAVGINHLRRALVHMGMKTKVRVMLYDDLPKNGTTESVFRGAKALIVLYTLHGKNADAVGHYVAIIKHSDHLEYFSSYGLPPEAEIAATHSDGKLMQLLGRNYRVSKAKLQSRFHSNTCARWAFARVLLHEIKNASFTKTFSEKMHFTKPDDLVSLATLFCIR